MLLHFSHTLAASDKDFIAPVGLNYLQFVCVMAVKPNSHYSIRNSRPLKTKH
jgi:hypothetical protein